MGVVSPLGTGVPAFWSALLEGRSGIRDLTRFDVSGFPYTQGGQVIDFAVPAALREAAARCDLATQFMLAAAQEAVRDARLIDHIPHRADTAVVLATNFGGILSGEKFLADSIQRRQPSGTDFHEYSFQTAVDHVADAWRLEGPRASLSLSCSSGTAAIAYGMDLIRTGRARRVLTGGYDALSPFAWSGLGALRTMTTDALRPFDKNRSGTIFSEGAGALLIEDADSARERGAGVYAEVAGFGLNNNAYHMTAPDKGGEGFADVMRLALADAAMMPDEVDHINTHGTATRYNDLTETLAIKAVFGAHAARIPITSIKSMTGHLMGAAGSAEAIASVLSLRDGVIPPTINYQTPDPECDLDCVTNVRRAMPLRSVMSNSAGIGGCNAVVIFRGAS